MSIEMKLPDVGDDEVEVTEILVKTGDTIELDQSLLTVEGDKASMEIPATMGGTIKDVLVKVGDKIKTGMPVLEIETEAKAATTEKVAIPKEDPNTIPSVRIPATHTTQDAKCIEKNILIPDIGDDEVEVTEIAIHVGDFLSVDQSVMTVEGDKASMEVPASISGQVMAVLVAVGDKVKTGSPVAIIAIASADNKMHKVSVKQEASDDSSTSAINKAAMVRMQKKESVPIKQPRNEFVENQAYAHATPSIRRLAREFGVNLANITGRGPKKRIMREDVQKYIKNAVGAISSSVTAGSSLSNILPWPNCDFNKFGPVDSMSLTKIQKLSGANLYRNWVTIPHVTEFDEADITELENFRREKNREAEKQGLGIKITPLVFIIKAVASVLKAYPRFNSSLSADGQTLILKKYINIGVAIDTPTGLVVPVIKSVNQLGILELSGELARLSIKARAGKLAMADTEGGCFTISSLGSLGTTAFTPIIKAPEVGILGVSRSSIKPVWDGTAFQPRLILPLSLSFDHRVIDGAEGARFLTHITKVLTDLRHLIM